MISSDHPRWLARLGGQAGEPAIKIVYKDGAEFDMTANAGEGNRVESLCSWKDHASEI